MDAAQLRQQYAAVLRARRLLLGAGQSDLFGRLAVLSPLRDLGRTALGPQAVALRWLPGTEADASDPPGFKPLDAAMRAVLDALGAKQLYRNQKEAIHEAARERRSVVVATPTASGKSLAYQVPLMATLGERRTSRAMAARASSAAQKRGRSRARCSGWCVSPTGRDRPRGRRRAARRACAASGR